MEMTEEALAGRIRSALVRDAERAPCLPSTWTPPVDGSVIEHSRRSARWAYLPALAAAAALTITATALVLRVVSPVDPAGGWNPPGTEVPVAFAGPIQPGDPALTRWAERGVTRPDLTARIEVNGQQVLVAELIALDPDLGLTEQRCYLSASTALCGLASDHALATSDAESAEAIWGWISTPPGATFVVTESHDGTVWTRTIEGSAWLPKRLVGPAVTAYDADGNELGRILDGGRSGYEGVTREQPGRYWSFTVSQDQRENERQAAVLFRSCLLEEGAAGFEGPMMIPSEGMDRGAAWSTCLDRPPGSAADEVVTTTIGPAGGGRPPECPALDTTDGPLDTSDGPIDTSGCIATTAGNLTTETGGSTPTTAGSVATEDGRTSLTPAPSQTATVDTGAGGAD